MTPNGPTRVEIGTIGRPPTEGELKEAPLPETVVMNFSRVCNLWCSHCFYPEMARKREASRSRETVYLPPDTLKRVADELAGWGNCVVLRIASDGEPLLHPEGVAMVAYAKSRRVTVSLTTNGIPLTAETVDYFMKNYLPETADPSDPRISPIRTQDLKGLAPALVYTAGFDMLLDQGEAYAQRLEEAGVKVALARFESLPHGFVAFPSAAPAAESAIRRIARETAAALKGAH